MATESLDNNVVVIDDEPNQECNEEPSEEPKDDQPTEAATTTNDRSKVTQKRKTPKKRKYFQYDRYNNAYGDYSGGYGPPGGGYGPPGGGYGPPGGGYGSAGGGYYPPGSGYGRNFGRPQNFGPPPPMFHSGPQEPPNFMWGRGFGPQGPPMRRQPMNDKIIKYLVRCGLAKENLKNLPRDLLQLMEPEYCGICAQSFESFLTSRVHYISKNHLKSQKKWLNQQSEVGFRRVKEMALKARELYCELCDVHITSKSHSDSHYAGKPHRSIVEGRKNPRNPILLQRGMEDRVAQLIRREKKNLKVVVEEEEVEKDFKNVQPELFCDICKTSVTCSEQMTMHLNGKKHLSKEKQHILKMMKGDGADADGEPQEKNDDDDDDMEVGDVDKEKDDGEKQSSTDDKYDWGNGSGSWDEIKDDDVY